MSDVLTLVGSAIYQRIGGTVQYTYLTGNGTALTTGTVGCYDSMAQQGAVPPYNIYQFMVGRDDYAFGDDWHSVSLEMSVRTVSDRQYPIQARQIHAFAHGRLQDAPLVVTGYATMRVRRTSPIEYRDSKLLLHSGASYRVDIVRVQT